MYKIECFVMALQDGAAVGWELLGQETVGDPGGGGCRGESPGMMRMELQGSSERSLNHGMV